MKLIGRSATHWLHRRAEVNFQQQNKNPRGSGNWILVVLIPVVSGTKAISAKRGQRRPGPAGLASCSYQLTETGMACTEQGQGKGTLFLPFTDRQCTASGRNCPLLLLVSAAEAAAFSSQTKCRLALCHRHLLNYFLRQGQKRNPVRWSPKPLP